MAKGSKSTTRKGGSSRRGSSTAKGSGSRYGRNPSKAQSNPYPEEESSYGKEHSNQEHYSDQGNFGKGGGSHYEDDTYGHGTNGYSKGGSTYEDSYENDSYSKNGNGYANDGYGQGKGGNSYQDDSDYGGQNNSKDYGHENDYSEENGYQDSYGKNERYESSHDNGGYGKGHTYSDNAEDGYDTGDSKGGHTYDNEPINDPPYDGYDEGVSAKQPQTDNRRETLKGGGDGNQEADMVFTEEEVYGDSQQDTERPRQQTNNNTIRRVWVWAGGAVPRNAISNPRSTWWQNRFNLGMTDYVIALNDHDFSNGLGIKTNYINRNDSRNPWTPIVNILRRVDEAGVAPHLMVFFPPNPRLIREAADVLTQIIEASPVTPRSIQLDLEGWWTRRSARDRQAGERAIQEHFIDRWATRRPELGIGITCIGGVPPSIYGAMEKVDFAIPQMYASERNYGRPISENSVRRHFNRAADALGRQGKIIVGQTAYSRFVNPQIMKEMLEVVLRQQHPDIGGVSEIAFWSDVHLMNSSRNRTFFRELTNLVKNEGLHLGNIENL